MSLQEKLQKARDNLNLSIESQEEIVSEELEDNVEDPGALEIVRNTEIAPSLMNSAQDVIQLQQLIQDFSFIRETLRENQQNGRRVLRSVAQDIMDSEEDLKASLILSFQELNKAIQENIKLYMTTYKTISETLKNIQSIQKIQMENKKNDPKDVQEVKERVSTQEIIARIREKQKEGSQ